MPLTRRGFLGRVTALASGGITAALIDQATRRAFAGKPNLALIGCGGRGAELARGWNQRHFRPLVALYDAVPARAEALAQEVGGSAVLAWQSLLEAPNLPALIIATPDDTHFAIAQAAIAAGKDVYLETPVVGPQDDLRSLVERDIEQRVHIGIDDPLFSESIQFHNFRDYGPIRHAQFHDRVNTRNAYLHAPDWQRDPARSFGPAASRVYRKALAYHLMVGCEIGLRDATLQHDGGPGRVPEHVVLSLHYENGCTAVFSASPNALAPQADMVRYAAGCMELLGEGHYRFTDDNGRVRKFSVDEHLHETFQQSANIWYQGVEHGAAAFCPLHHAIPIHNAFAKALA